MRGLLAAAALSLAGCAPPGVTPRVVLVSIDTLRADRLGLYGHPTALTPNLDAFAAEALVFERAYSQANVTNMSHASLMSSRYPSELGPAADSFVPAPDIPLLAEILTSYGWQTGAAVGGGHLVPGLGLERGFEHFERPAPLGGLYHTAPAALAQLDAMDPDRPWLLFVHGYDTHQRYLAPSPFGLLHAEPGYDGPATRVVQDPVGTSFLLDGRYYEQVDLGTLLQPGLPRVWGADNRDGIRTRARERDLPTTRLAPADLAYVSAVYDGAVTWADAWFGLLLEALDERGVLEDAWVIVLSDHGENLGEDGLFGHNLSLADATLHVPLLIRPPGGLARGARVERSALLLDVLPTVLDLAGIPRPALVHGVSLVPALDGQPLPDRPVTFAEGQVRMIAARGAQGGLTMQGISAESPWLAPLLASAALEGPAFEGSTAQDPATREALRDAMLAWRGALRPSTLHATPPSPQQLEALRKQGYWSTR